MSDEAKEGNEGSKDVTKLTDDPAFQQMQKAMQGITLLVQQGTVAQKQMQENFTTLIEKIDAGTPKPKHVSLEDQEDNINDLDNFGLMKLVVSEVGKVVDNKLDKVTDNLSATQQSVNDTRLAGEVKELLSDHKDLLDWKSEMGALAKENPNLSIGRLYILARMEDADKAKDLDEKYKDEIDEDKDKNAGFLGLMPTSGGFNDDSEDNKVTKEEAGEKAWDETIANFPALASLGDD